MGSGGVGGKWEVRSRWKLNKRKETTFLGFYVLGKNGTGPVSCKDLPVTPALNGTAETSRLLDCSPIHRETVNAGLLGSQCVSHSNKLHRETHKRVCVHSITCIPSEI